MCRSDDDGRVDVDEYDDRTGRNARIEACIDDIMPGLKMPSTTTRNWC